VSTKTLGFYGENYASNLLLKSGYKILERNFRAKFGEIDIVALKEGILIFVEVKTRKSGIYGKPEEAVTPYKVLKIERVGQLYSKLHPDLPKKLRIDVVSLIIENNIVTSQKIIKAT